MAQSWLWGSEVAVKKSHIRVNMKEESIILKKIIGDHILANLV